MARKVAKLFKSRTKARPSGIPKEFRFEGSEVYIEKEGDRAYCPPRERRVGGSSLRTCRSFPTTFLLNPETCPRRSATGLDALYAGLRHLRAHPKGQWQPDWHSRHHDRGPSTEP